MKVGISAGWLGTGSGGVETYLRNLIRVLPVVEPANEYLLVSRHPRPADGMPTGPGIQHLVVDQGSRWDRLPLSVSRAVAQAHLSVIHEQITAPFLFGAPLVVTIHDLFFEHFPGHASLRHIAQMRLRTWLTVRRAAAVITDSEFCKQDLVRRYAIPPDKVTVAYLAADPLFRPLHDPARLAAVRARYATGEHYILFVGALKPNKNLRRVIEAYVRLRRADALRHRLVLAGARAAWLREDIFAPARDAGYEEDLVFTGYVPAEDLVALYNAADLFVQPSLFEGFGLPPLEAMACGTPVVTSTTTSLPEVVGDAAVQVDPLDVEALAQAMARVLHDEALHAHLVELGLARAASFSWETTARTVLGVYRHVAERDARG